MQFPYFAFALPPFFLTSSATLAAYSVTALFSVLTCTSTSFSILFARFKGNLKTAAAGAAAIDRLKDGDKILISEGCTHHRQCDDIGTVKLPRWIRNYTGKDLEFEYSSGRDFPEDVTKYNLIVHCGGCMLNEREMRYRQKCALDQEIPITNYGIAIAYMQGILKRCVEMFPDVRKELDQ